LEARGDTGVSEGGLVALEVDDDLVGDLGTLTDDFEGDLGTLTDDFEGDLGPLADDLDLCEAVLRDGEETDGGVIVGATTTGDEMSDTLSLSSNIGAACSQSR
jgi:hypothetical protein